MQPPYLAVKAEVTVEFRIDMRMREYDWHGGLYRYFLTLYLEKYLDCLPESGW
jgi:hypothetical protein